ncbi:MAG: hypothetical protein A2Y12_05505 [Planctomycetes bacterium GWF2_42_9]|nr:MAG: hypothetical protein A2Y12_05505 [Planctomycetes bacterium GWF2_42_9]
MSDTLLKLALEYHKLGWSLMPLLPGSKKQRNAWKKYQTQRADQEQIRAWFGNGQSLNIAVIVGEVSGGLAIRDFDNMTSYEKWAKAYSYLAKTLPSVRTAKGVHVYFEGHVEGIKYLKDGSGELRGDGGYCLLPPSVHPNGTRYEWINPVFNGNLLCIDPELSGLMGDVTEKTEHTEQKEQSEKTEQLEAIRIGESIEKIIARTLPTGNGMRNRRVFDFVRAIKSLPQYSNADPLELRPLVEQWHKSALSKIQTKDFEESWIDFLKGWERVRYLEGEEPLAVIFKQVQSEPLPEMAVKLYPSNPKIQILVAVCMELQRLSGEEPFYLATRPAGKYLEVSAMQASRYLFLLCMEKVLIEVKKGAGSKASRYRYIAKEVNNG